jgi:hypothetical protein
MRSGHQARAVFTRLRVMYPERKSFNMCFNMALFSGALTILLGSRGFRRRLLMGSTIAGVFEEKLRSRHVKRTTEYAR